MTTTLTPRPTETAPSRPVEAEQVLKVRTGAPVTTHDVWRAIARASFAVISYVTPHGEPRSSGVVYATVGQRLYLAVAPDSWKARHIALNSHVSLTVPVRRGGLLTLLMPIPPATISFQAEAIVRPAASLVGSNLEKALSSLLPPERRSDACVIEIIPEGEFLTYGIGVSLMQMRTPSLARGRVEV